MNHRHLLPGESRFCLLTCPLFGNVGSLGLIRLPILTHRPPVVTCPSVHHRNGTAIYDKERSKGAPS
jgi:hypothetical protein